MAGAAADVVTIVAGLGTTTIAFLALHNWKKEIRFRASFEAARKLAESAYRVRNEFRKFRDPLLSSWEFPEGYTSTKASPRESAEAYSFLYRNRFKPLLVAASDLESAALEAEAIWGPRPAKLAAEIRSCVITLQAATQSFIGNEMSGGEDFKNKDFGKKIRSQLSSAKDDDDLSLRMKASISELENFLKPHLRRGQ